MEHTPRRFYRTSPCIQQRGGDFITPERFRKGKQTTTSRLCYGPGDILEAPFLDESHPGTTFNTMVAL